MIGVQKGKALLGRYAGWRFDHSNRSCVDGTAGEPRSLINYLYSSNAQHSDFICSLDLKLARSSTTVKKCVAPP